MTNVKIVAHNNRSAFLVHGRHYTLKNLLENSQFREAYQTVLWHSRSEILQSPGTYLHLLYCFPAYELEHWMLPACFETYGEETFLLKKHMVQMRLSWIWEYLEEVVPFVELQLRYLPEMSIAHSARDGLIIPAGFYLTIVFQ